MGHSGTPRVLVVSTDPEALVTISDGLLPFAPLTFGTLGAVRAELASGAPAVVVADGGLFDDVAADHGLVEASAGVVVVLGEIDVEVLRRAMAAGIGDVVDTAHLDRLPSAVASLWQRNLPRAGSAAPTSASAPGRLVVVTSSKDGQGTTTVAVNLAVALTGAGRTALVEADPRYGDVRAALGCRTEDTHLARADLLGDHWLDAHLHRHRSGVILAMPRPDTSTENFEMDDAVAALTALQRIATHTVIDLPRWVLELYPVHRLADVVLVVTRDGVRDLAHARTLVGEAGLSPATTRLVVSDYVDGRTPKRRDMEQLTGLRTAGRIPEVADATGDLDDGLLLVEDARHPEAAEAFAELAAAVRDLLTPSP